jgi:hypothetical protein
MNSYIQTKSNFATEEAAGIELVATGDDSVTTGAAYSASGVSILDDAEGNIKAVLGEKKSDVVEASCENIPTGISLCCDSAFAHKKEISIFKFPERILEISWRDLTISIISTTIII